MYQCIHIYTTLDSLDELRKSYQADRKVRHTLFHMCCNDTHCPRVQAQSDLILPSPLPLASFLSLTQEITGFFIVETHVLRTTGAFRSESEIEELWDALVSRLSAGLQWALKSEVDPNEFLKVKECLIGFIITLEVSHGVFLILCARKALIEYHSPIFIPQLHYIRLYWSCLKNTQCFLRSNLVKDLTR